MSNELYDIPTQARLCYEKNKGLILPDKVPYIGMGSSYFAAVTLRYLGVKIFPEMAGEYYHYIRNIKQFDNAVLISQSGRTTDVLKCAPCFKEYTAIVNEPDSPLANQPNAKSKVMLCAGNELMSSTKTFINTLVALYLGHGFDVKAIIDLIEERFVDFELTGSTIGAALYKSIKKQKARCIILGSGPNVGIASHAALMLSETVRYPFVGMSLSQFEHGYKEAAEDTVALVINPAKGVMHERTKKLMNLLRQVNAHVYEINDREIDELYSPFTAAIPLYFMAEYLSSKLHISDPFQFGNKITERPDEMLDL
jgi:glucosamine--fructose-6-phosphate aminotransferase (isomerizing)